MTRSTAAKKFEEFVEGTVEDMRRERAEWKKEHPFLRFVKPNPHIVYSKQYIIDKYGFIFEFGFDEGARWERSKHL